MNWTQEFRKSLVSIKQLEKFGLLSDSLEELRGVEDGLNIRVPERLLNNNLLNAESSSDASVALQVIPSKKELRFLSEELSDPIGDEDFSPVQGITHRYPDRVLLKPTYHCGMYCRFCFRRNKVSKPNLELSSKDLIKAFAYIKSQPAVREVILTGGDAFTLLDDKLFHILEQLEKIESVKVVRFHTRCLTAFPNRITQELLEILSNYSKKVWIVHHINSPAEWNAESLEILCKLQKCGVSMASQSVLLKGVNGTAHLLKELFLFLYENGVVPYYLHYPDLAKGTNHFRLPLSHCLKIVTSLRGKMSGMSVPNLMVDIPGGLGKVPVDSHFSNCIFQSKEKEIWNFLSPLTGGWKEVNYSFEAIDDDVL